MIPVFHIFSLPTSPPPYPHSSRWPFSLLSKEIEATEENFHRLPLLSLSFLTCLWIQCPLVHQILSLHPSSRYFLFILHNHYPSTGLFFSAKKQMVGSSFLKKKIKPFKPLFFIQPSPFFSLYLYRKTPLKELSKFVVSSLSSILFWAHSHQVFAPISHRNCLCGLLTHILQTFIWKTPSQTFSKLV